MEGIVEFVSSTLFGGGLGAIIGYLVQHHLSRKSVRIDSLRVMLIEYARTVSAYWNRPWKLKEERAQMEAEIKVNQMILFSEFRALATKYSSIRKVWEEAYVQMLTDLVVNATGGTFESKDWKSEPWRALAVTRTITKVLGKLP